MSADEMPEDDDSSAGEPSGARPPTPGWRERRASESGGDVGGALAPFEPEIPATLQALARVLSSSARPRWLMTDDDAEEELPAPPETDGGERPSEPVVEVEAPPGPPLPMVPIAVPLPLVSPPPLPEPPGDPRRPRAPRWRVAAAVAACCLAGLVAGRYARSPARPAAPAAPAPAETAPATSARAALEEARTPASPAAPATPEPPRNEKAAAGKGRTGAGAASGPCRVLSGKPCF